MNSHLKKDLNKCQSPPRKCEVLSLAGSQVNISHRQKKSRTRNPDLIRPSSSCETSISRHSERRRPLSADISLTAASGAGDRHHFKQKPNMYCIRSDTIDSMRQDTCLSRCQKAGFCGSDSLINASKTGVRFTTDSSCRKFNTSHHQEDVAYYPCKTDFSIPYTEPDFMRYAYTAESAQLLKTLLQEPWKSDESEEETPRSGKGGRHPPSPEIPTRPESLQVTPKETGTDNYKSLALEENYKNQAVCFSAREYKSPISVRSYLSSSHRDDTVLDKKHNLDSIPSKDSERTESTLYLRDVETEEQTKKDEELDVKFKRWFQNSDKNNDNDGVCCPVLIDLTEDKKVPLEPEKINYNIDKSVTLEKTGKTSARDSTLEDIENILQVINDDSDSNVTKTARVDSVPANSASCFIPPLSKATPLDLDTEKPKTNQVAEIFQFLDQAERHPDILKSTTNPSRHNRTCVVPEISDSSVPRMDELLCRSTVDLAQEVLSLRLQAEEQAGGIRLLQQTISELKLAVKDAKVAHQAELRQASNEAEAALLRHQKMVKQLLAEKKSLNEKMSSMMEEIKASEERHQRNLKAMEERHLVEIQRVKETHAVAEKLKREKWIDVKTQKIKEMTVKGLEPELSRMAARQQQEMSELRSLHRSELEALELRSARRTAELMDELRAELTRDKEEALQREIALQRTKWEKKLEEETRLQEQEIRRLKEELRRERDRMCSLEAHVQEQLGEARRMAERERERDRAILAREWQSRLDEAARQQQLEIKNLKDALDLEKDVWMNNYKKLQTNKFLEREAELHHQYKRERDRDIEIAIERLETEATKARLELTEAADNKLKRLREKLEGEIKDVEAECSSLKLKLSETRQQLADREDHVTELTAQLRHLQAEFTQLKKLSDEMSAEREDLRKILQGELDAQLQEAHNAADAVRREIAELKTCHAVELAKRDQISQAMCENAERQLQQVYNRVKMTIKKKDEALEVQKEQYRVALERCSHLEQMLENQRKNLLLN